MFDPMFDAIARILAFFYSLPVVGNSYGFAIMLLTAAVMMLLMPLTLRATRSTIAMQEVQPKLKELQKKHADDRQTLNAELMELYRAHGINPVGGCLPMLAQLPVFLVLFNVLRGLSRRASEAPFFAISQQARAQVGVEPLQADHFDPQYLNPESEMYQALSGDTEMLFGPFDLAAEARNVIQDNIVQGIPYVILILFVVATSFYQQRQVSSRRTGTVAINPQQEMILKVLPLASGVWSFLFPAGLVLYWATSNVFRIGQQSYITRAYYGDEKNSPSADGDGATGNGSASAGDDEDSSPDDDGEDDADNSSSKKNGGSSKTTASKNNKNSNTKKKSGSSGSSKTKTSMKQGSGTDKSDGANGDSSSNGSSDLDREEAWARKRARAKASSRSRSEQSSRVTPKGTKPTGSRKKRKR